MKEQQLERRNYGFATTATALSSCKRLQFLLIPGYWLTKPGQRYGLTGLLQLSSWLLANCC
jgi:hypothetical protein